MDIDRAVEVFVRGFSFTRSFTHPYVPERVGPLWVVRDAPRRTIADYRNEEWIARGVPPADVDRLARKHRYGRYAICAIVPTGEPDAPVRAAYKELGYRLKTTEPLMAHALRRVPRFDPPAGVAIERVRTQALADRLAKAARSRQVLPEHLAAAGANDGGAPLRQYVALAGGEIVGWVRSIDTAGGTWCSNMHVVPTFRRRGVGRAMLCRLLRDDRAAGSTGAVLTASHAGALLYPLVGYEQTGMLLAYTPKS